MEVTEFVATSMARKETRALDGACASLQTIQGWSTSDGTLTPTTDVVAAGFAHQSLQVSPEQAKP